MAKYLVETYYNCSFKVSHYLEEVSNQELQNLEKRYDGKIEILDVKLDKRKTKSLDQKNKIQKDESIHKLDIIPDKTQNKINNGQFISIHNIIIIRLLIVLTPLVSLKYC